MNLGTFRTRISGEIGMSNTNGSSEQALIDSWMNDAVVQFLAETKVNWKPFTAPLTTDSDTYDLSSSVLAIKSLYIIASDGTISPMLEPTTTDDIIWRKRFAPGGWAPIGYSLEGGSLLMLSSKARAGDTLAGLYVPAPTPMANIADDPSTPTYGGIPAEFHETLVQYGLWKASIWDDNMGSAMSGTRRFVMIGAAYQQAWEQGIMKAKARLSRKAGRRLAPIRPGGRHKRRYFPTTPGTDTGR